MSPAGVLQVVSTTMRSSVFSTSLETKRLSSEENAPGPVAAHPSKPKWRMAAMYASLGDTTPR
jgi:hypothetical protein